MSSLVSCLCIKTSGDPLLSLWGITQWRKQDLESGPLKEHICVHFSKYELNQLDRTEGERVHFPNNGWRLSIKRDYNYFDI